MKRYLLILLLAALILSVSSPGRAQVPLWFREPIPFFSPLFSPYPFLPYLGIFPRLPVLGPYISPPLAPRTSLSLLSPVRMPRPALRQAAATVTIFFNPTLSVIQVTVLPLSPVTPLAPVTAVAPAVATPALGLTALALLPLLSGLTGPTQTKTLTRLSTTAPAIPTLTGLTALLPLI
ncbi:MAG: hypothetical protein ACMUIS_11120 [bacterium]